MSPRAGFRRWLCGALSMLALTLAIDACGAGGGPDGRSELAIATPAGVGGLRLGSSPAALRRAQLIGPLHKGCELDRGQMVAPLRAPLHGTAIFSPPRTRLTAITLESGARTASGVHIGSSAAQALAAFPGAQYDRPQPRAPIPVGFIWVDDEHHQRLTLAIDPLTHRVIEIDVPSANVCE